MHLVLASRSPRRADLLASAGYRFDVRPAVVDESVGAGEPPAAYVARVAAAKAQAAAAGAADAIVLGADTVVVVGGEILGKPADDAEAAAMLRRLSGRPHEVLTGMALRWRGAALDGLARTRVRFRALSDAEVAAYVASGEPRDKAGAYAIQGRAGEFVERIEGSYSNVVGLPMELLGRLLDRLTGAGRLRCERSD